MPHTDWLPRREQDFVDLCQTWITIIGKDENLSNFNWDMTECTEVINKINAFLATRTAYETDDSSAKRLVKDDTKEEARDAMRDFANAAIRFNKKLTEADKLALGIRPKDTTPTQHHTPASQPETIVENTKNHYEHTLIALHPDGKIASKPADTYGIKYAWQVGGEKPSSGEDLPKSHFSRKTNHTITHTEADKGKPAYYATRYENGKGDGGPWSPIVDAFIG